MVEESNTPIKTSITHRFCQQLGITLLDQRFQTGLSLLAY
nr:MAG TPA: hypothetical protein [Caudoviricetes sp.]